MSLTDIQQKALEQLHETAEALKKATQEHEKSIKQASKLLGEDSSIEDHMSVGAMIVCLIDPKADILVASGVGHPIYLEFMEKRATQRETLDF